MKSITIVFPEARRVELIEEQVPDPPAGKVIVRMTVSLMSTGTESFCYRGEFDEQTNWSNWVKYPFYPGYSGVGTVVKIGPDVTGVREGDAVFCGGAHRQYSLRPADRIVVIPDGIGHEDASWSALSNIAQTAVRRAEHAMGETAVVIGLGPIGQLVTQYLNVVGLREILAVDTVSMRLQWASEHGATRSFCGTASEAKQFVADHTGGVLADAVYDATGHWSVFPDALRMVRDFGRVVLVGDTPHPSRQHLSHDVMMRQLTVLGTHNAKLQPRHAWWTEPRQIELFQTYVRRGQLRVGDLITHRHPPEAAPQVYEQLQQDRSQTLGILFDWRGL